MGALSRQCRLTRRGLLGATRRWAMSNTEETIEVVNGKRPAYRESVRKWYIPRTLRGTQLNPSQ